MSVPVYPGTSQPVMAVGGLLLDSAGHTITNGTSLFYPGGNNIVLATASRLNDPLGNLVTDGTSIYYPGGGNHKMADASGLYSLDGTAGATAGPFTVVSSIQVKNGLVTTLTGS